VSRTGRGRHASWHDAPRLPSDRTTRGSPACAVQLQATDSATTAGMIGVTATNPMSRIGEFGRENTSLTAATMDPSEPS